MNDADYTRWCDRYGDCYTTERDRRDGYADYLTNRAELVAVFGA